MGPKSPTRRASAILRPLAAILAFLTCWAPFAARAQTIPQPVMAELEQTRTALQKYQDPLVAIRDGYFSTLGCVHYAEGAMGIHFLNTALIGPVPDPLKPQLLIYEPMRDGKLRLVAAEWFVPLATGIRERPTLFGRPFDGPMAGHEPLMPSGLHHYDLHVWLFKDNPAGMFNTTNPNVSCDGYSFALLEQPPPTVPHH